MATTIAKQKLSPTAKTKKRNTSIARFAIRHYNKDLGKVFDKDASLLPENKWIIQTSKKLINEDPDFKKKIKQTALISGGILAGIGGVIATVYLAPAIVVIVVVNASIATGIAMGIDKIKSLAKDIKANHLPAMVDKFKLEIVKHQFDSAKQAFKRQKEALLKKRANSPPSLPRLAKPEGETFKKMKKDATKWAFKKVASVVKSFKDRKTNDVKPNDGQNPKKNNNGVTPKKP